MTAQHTRAVTEFKQDTEETPVIFRASRTKDAEVTAVFPCEPATYDGDTMSCYAHLGQHSGCSLGWYNTTRAARPEEYADLKAELESAPYGYRFKVYRRMTRDLRDRFMDEVRRLRASAKASGYPGAAP